MKGLRIEVLEARLTRAIQEGDDVLACELEDRIRCKE